MFDTFHHYPHDEKNFPNGEIPPNVQQARDTLETSCRFLAKQWQGKSREELEAALSTAEDRMAELRAGPIEADGGRSEAVGNQIVVAKRLIQNLSV